MFRPKLLTTLESYDRHQLAADLAAGIIVGIVALPLAIAFAIASGVAPSRGLATAIIAGFVISALGGSRVQVGGPTGAFVVIVYGIVQRYGVDGLVIATVLAGLMLIVAGIAKLGTLIQFIPHPIVIGFTSGIAITIFSGEVKDLLGLRIEAVPADFVGKWSAIARHVTTFNLAAIGLSAATIAIIVLWPKVNRRVPGTFVALLATTAIAHALGLPVETIGTKFGGLAATLPQLAVPHVSLEQLGTLVRPALTIAMLGAVESLLSATVADGMIGGRHRPNTELIAQGVANVIAPLLGGMPATGAIARTATNVKNGGRTPIAGMTHAITLLLITLFFGRWAALIPLATLAGILTVVSYNMSEWRSFAAELRAPKSDVVVLVATFVLTILVDLTVAIEVGMVAAAFLFLRRMAQATRITSLADSTIDIADPADSGQPVACRAIPAGVELFEVDGPLFFGVAALLQETLREIAQRPAVLILRLRHVPMVDSTALHAFEQLARVCRREGTHLLLAEAQPQPLAAIARSRALAELGRENLLPTLQTALARARVLVAPS